jgi:hypothetical protein
MARIEEKPVAAYPFWIIGVEIKVFREQYMDEISATHCPSGMARPGFFNHRHRKNAYVVGSP